jgi:hypothetical protein
MRWPKGRTVNIVSSILVPVAIHLMLFVVNVFIFQWGTALGPFLYVFPIIYIAVGLPFLWRALAWRALLAAIVYIPLMLGLMFLTAIALENVMSFFLQKNVS